MRGVDLDARWGETLCLLGSNGSGKTTLIKILAGLTKPDAGEALIAPARGERGAAARRLAGVVTHDPLLYDGLTARENLRFACRMFALDDADSRIESASERVGMSPRLDQKVGAMSHGMKKRFSIARALLHDPPILLMDEPESGLDQDALALLDAIILDYSSPRRAALVTTHDIGRATALADRVAILAGGRIAYDAPIAANGASSARDAYRLHAGADARI